MRPKCSLRAHIYLMVIVIFAQAAVVQTARQDVIGQSGTMLLKHGSFGVAFIRGDTITVGIDSRITGDHELADTACKIFESKGVIFAIVGLFAHYGFNVRDEARRILMLPLPLQDRIAHFDSTIIHWMSTWTDSITYRYQFLDSEEARNLVTVRALFATFADGEPTFYYHWFIPSVSGAHILVKTRFEKNSIPRGGGATHLVASPLGAIARMLQVTYVLLMTPARCKLLFPKILSELSLVIRQDSTNESAGLSILCR